MLDQWPVVYADDPFRHVNRVILVDCQQPKVERRVMKLRHAYAILHKRLTKFFVPIRNDVGRIYKLWQM